ncbi:MAG: S-layer protein, partial [Methanoregula sp.]
TGDATVYSAQARVSAVDPFSSDEDIAYIGDLQPNESRIVTYQISVDRSATQKQYGLDSEIRYRDAEDNTHISEVMKVNVNITGQSGIAVILSNPIYLSIVAAVIIGLLYLGYHLRKKQ